jgi:enoyl-CoA hydratase/carnithine racemase
MFKTVGLVLTLNLYHANIYIFSYVRFYLLTINRKEEYNFSSRDLIEELHPIIKEALERRPEVSCVL